MRFAQVHETFRKPELEALAELHGLDLEIIDYRNSVGESLLNVSSLLPLIFYFTFVLLFRPFIFSPLMAPPRHSPLSA